MIYTSFEQLAERIFANHNTKRVMAAIAPEEGHTLEAIAYAVEKQLVDPILFGNKPVIIKEMEKLGLAPDAFFIEHVDSNEQAAYKAGMAVKEGRAHFLMKGLIPTGLMLKTLFAEEVGFRVGQFVSHMSIVQIPNYHKLVVIMDAAISIAPTLEQKKVILENALVILHRLGMQEPKVAVLSAVEYPNPKMPESLDAAELKAMNIRGELTGCIVEGPLSYDLAMCAESAVIKGVKSPVYGNADVLLCPNIVTANVLLKSLRYSAGALSASIVVGGVAPIVLTSRSATTQDKYWPMVLAASATL